MLRCMSNEWAYPIRKLVQLAVRILYQLYKSGKITRRYVPGSRVSRTRILQLLIRKGTNHQMAPTPKGKNKKQSDDEEDMDLGELEDMDLGDLDLELDTDDLDEVLEEMDEKPKKGKKGVAASAGVSDEALLTLTKEIRDNNTQVLAKVSKTEKAVTSVQESLVTVLEQIKKLFSFLKADVERQKEDVKKTKEILDKPKTSKKPAKEEEDEEESEIDMDDATQGRVRKLYKANFTKYSSIPKFAAAAAKALKADEDDIVQVLRAAGWVGRGGKCKDPSEE